MIINDLNTLEVVDGASVVGGFFGEGFKSTNVYTTVDTFVYGHLAQSQGTANASGSGTATEVDNNTSTTPYSSHSDGSSTSASSGGYYWY